MSHLAKPSDMFAGCGGKHPHPVLEKVLSLIGRHCKPLARPSPLHLTCEPWAAVSNTRVLPGEGAWTRERTAPREMPEPSQCHPGASSWPVLECPCRSPLCPFHRTQLLELSRTRAGTVNMAAMAQLALAGCGNRIFQMGACNRLCPGIFCLVHQFLAGPAAALVLNKADIQFSVQQLKGSEDKIFSFQGMTWVPGKCLNTVSSELASQRAFSAVRALLRRI